MQEHKDEILALLNRAKPPGRVGLEMRKKSLDSAYLNFKDILSPHTRLIIQEGDQCMSSPVNLFRKFLNLIRDCFFNRNFEVFSVGK